LRGFTRLDRYVARLIVVPLFATLGIAAMLLLLDKMLKLFDFVVNEGGPVSVVWKMLGNLLPEYLALGIPIGLVLGILLAFRKLATSSELDALLSVGMSYNRLLRVPYLFAIGLALVNFAIVGWIQPLSRYNYEGLRFELRSGALGASITVGEFARLGKRMTLRVEESMEQGRDLRGIFVRAMDKDGQSLAVTARRGTFLATDDPDVILFRLTDGTLVHSSPSYTEPRVLEFAMHDLPIDLPRFEAFRDRGNDADERTLPELVAVSLADDTPEAMRNDALAKLQRRLVQCVVMLVLPLLAVALAVPPKRSTSALGVFISVVMIVTYHKITQYAERMGSIGRVDPVIAQWVPFALFSALCIWLYYVLAYRPGGEPIGALQKGFGALGRAIGKLVRPGRWRDDALSAG
jgi:lipopolysaccharide export system permease protein